MINISLLDLLVIALFPLALFCLWILISQRDK